MMKDYMRANKEAWEEAFSHKKDGWGEDVVQNIQRKPDFYIKPPIKSILDKQNLKSKKIAQFCCNNGRELLSITKHYGVSGTGFDIAENLVSEGIRSCKELALPCEFIATNILDVGAEYNQSFDIVLFTIGAIIWFEDLEELFKVASRCLKPNGMMILHEIHPVMNMLPLPEEDEYRNDIPVVLEHKYFSKEPYIETNGMEYISGEYESKTFTSFAHSMSKIINSVIKSGMVINLMNEYDYDIGLSDVYDGKGLPLSMLLVSSKQDIDLSLSE